MGGLGTMVLRPSGLLGLRTRDRPRTMSQLLRRPSQYLPSSPRGQRDRPSRSHQSIRCSGQALFGVVAAVPHNTFGEPMYSFARVRRSRRTAVAGLAVLALAASGSFAANAATPTPAHNDGKDGLKQVGPIDETNGYPLWYKDTNNVRLELCLDPGDANCIMGDLPNARPAGLVPGQLPGRGLLLGGRLRDRRRRRRQGAAGDGDGGRLRHRRRPAGQGRADHVRPDPDPCRRTGRRCGLHRHAPVRRGARRRPRPAR